MLYKSLPKFTLSTFLITTAISAIIWQINLIITHKIIFFFLSTFRKQFPSNELILAKSEKDKVYYSSYFHAVTHALVSASGALYCAIYADGSFGTTWFHCNFYKLQMFDV